MQRLLFRPETVEARREKASADHLSKPVCKLVLPNDALGPKKNGAQYQYPVDAFHHYYSITLPPE